MTLQTRVPGKFPPVPMGGRAEGLACADPGARTPIGASGNLSLPYTYKRYGHIRRLDAHVPGGDGKDWQQGDEPAVKRKVNQAKS